MSSRLSNIKEAELLILKKRITAYRFLYLCCWAAAELNKALAFNRAHAVRIPEHTCQKQISMKICESYKCQQVCYVEAVGVGDCRGTSCFCTYYCKQPPI